MPTLTLKHLPAEVHRLLKARAKRHGRSLNSEAIACLRAWVNVERVDVDGLLARARKVRAEAARPLGLDELEEMRGEGRA